MRKNILFRFFVLLAFFSFTLLTKAGTVDSKFLPTLTVSGRVNTIVRQADGKFIVAGLFTAVNSSAVNNISRLNVDGSVDASFNSGTGANAPINSLLVQPDGKILVGGEFTRFNQQTANRLVRLNLDGSIDSTFNARNNVGNVYSLALQNDSKILVGGNFNKLLVRLNSDGSIDNAFTSNTSGFGGNVLAISILENKKILIGGNFSQFSNSVSQNLVRLNQDGSVDNSFNVGVGPNGGVSAFAVQPDGKIILGGTFTLFQGVATIYIARINSDGSIDQNYPTGEMGTGFNDSITSLNLQPDGKLIVAGFFKGFSVGFNFTSRNRILRLNADGTLDASFNPNNGFDNVVRNFILHDDKITAVGSFTSYDSSAGFGIAQLNSNGNIDSSFKAGAGLPTETYVVKRLSNDKILVGGSFDMVNGVSRPKLALLNAEGKLDTSFTPSVEFSGPVHSVDIQPDGKILLGAISVLPNGAVRYVVRLNSNGSLDQTFDSKVLASEITKVKILENEKILIGGNFEDFGGITRKNLARLNSDGSLDTSFATGIGFNGAVADFEIQSDGKIVVCGYFTAFNGITRPSIARLNIDGSLDQSFNVSTSPASSIYDIFIQNDGKILLGGGFNVVNSVSRNGIVRLNADSTLDASFTSPLIGSGVTTITIRPNGKILTGGFLRTGTSLVTKSIVQLNGDGSVNNSINPNLTGAVYSIENLTDGRILVGGRMNAPSTLPLEEALDYSVARVIPQAVKSDFDQDGKADISVFRPSNGVWYLNQSNVGFSAVQFGVSSDKLVPADYDGDEKIDIAVFRDGVWYILRSNLGFTAVQFGLGGDFPQPSDFDGDGRSELAVFRPSNGTWYVLNLVNNQFDAVPFGTDGDKPVAADYDYDGKADFGVFRPSNGTWYLLRSSQGFTAIQFGISTDIPVVGDYDGDGLAEPAVYRDGMWYLLRSSQGFTGFKFGLATDIPTPADYDGDGKVDAAVFRDSTWYVLQSTKGFITVQFGAANDKAIPNAYVP